MINNYFQGKHYLVSGGSSGIGKSIAIYLDQLGAKVSIVGRNEDRLIDTISSMKNANGKYYKCDLSDLKRIDTLVDQIFVDGGKIDGFVHCAGIVEFRPLKLSNEKFVKKIFDIHTFAYIEIIRVALKKKIFNNGASIIGISSAATKDIAYGSSIYTASKGAIDAFVKSVAVELGKQNIRINNVALAMVNTNKFQEFLSNGISYEKIIGKQYLGVIELENVNYTIEFLLSDKSKFITGSVVEVFAGR